MEHATAFKDKVVFLSNIFLLHLRKYYQCV